MRPKDRDLGGRLAGGHADASAVGHGDRPLGLYSQIVVIGFVVLSLALALVLSSGIGFFAGTPYALVGAFVAIHRPRNSVGWLLLAFAWAFIAAFIGVPATAAELLARTATVTVAARAVLQGWAGGALFVLTIAITIVFPMGRFPSGRWGGVARLALTAGVVLAVLSAFAPTISVTPDGSSASMDVPNPLAAFPGSPLWTLVSASAPITLVLAAAGVISMGVRLRRARGMEGAQLRWVVWSLAFIIAGILVGLVGDVVFPNGLNGLVWIPAEIAFPLPPVAIGVAVLRYRLYEIDRLISRSIGWAVLTAILAGVFVALILVSQTLIAPFTRSNEPAVAGSTLLVFAVFQPLRRRVQRLVDRRFNRARYDAERTVATFAGRLRDEVDLEQLRAEIRATVAHTVEPSSVSLWLRE